MRSPSGYDVWLLLLGLNLILIVWSYGLVALSQAQQLGFNLYVGRPIDIGSVLFDDIPIYIVCAVLPIATLYLYFSKSRHFPKLCTGMFAALMIWQIYVIFRHYVVFESMGYPVSFEWVLGQFLDYSSLIRLLQLLVWPIYFERSVRVANAFIH